MFNFFSMANNYDERKVDNFQDGDLCIDTCAVTDGAHPYETAVESPLYNNGLWVIVEAYDTREEAQAGHNKWVKIMTENPPEALQDCQNSFISQLLDDDDLYFESKD